VERARERVGGVLPGLSVVEMVDSFPAGLLNEIGATTRRLCAETAAGIRPAAAITLVEPGMELRGVGTSLDAAWGSSLRRRLGAERSRPRR
jgi:rsbT antagonist protein RsbS